MLTFNISTSQEEYCVITHKHEKCYLTFMLLIYIIKKFNCKQNDMPLVNMHREIWWILRWWDWNVVTYWQFGKHAMLSCVYKFIKSEIVNSQHTKEQQDEVNTRERAWCIFAQQKILCVINIDSAGYVYEAFCASSWTFLYVYFVFCRKPGVK